MKNRPPKYRFIAVFAIAMLLIVLVTLALNTWGLKGYYTQQKIKSMQSAYLRIDEVIADGEDSELSRILDEYSERENISIAIYDTYTSMVLVSSERDNEFLLQRLRDKLFGTGRNTDERTLMAGDDYSITRGGNDIEFFGYCSDNRMMVLMSTPVQSMENAAEQSNHFLILVGIAALVIGIAAVVVLTGKVSRVYALEIENEKLQHDLEEKERQNQIQREFVANVSHELKTPITIIKGYAEGLSEGLCNDAESRNYYSGVIADEAERMHQIVQQLLMLSKIESGQDEPEKTDFNLSDMIRSVASGMNILAEKKNASLLSDIPDDIIVSADELKIESVITNYLSNAVHYVNEGGRISVRVSDGAACARTGKSVRAGTGSDAAAGAGDRVHVSVFNTGAPIPDEALEHIWDKFYKADKAHARSYGGSGIGLSIVKAVMDAHGMPYGVTNHVDGVEFWFELEKKK